MVHRSWSASSVGPVDVERVGLHDVDRPAAARPPPATDAAGDRARPRARARRRRTTRASANRGRARPRRRGRRAARRRGARCARPCWCRRGSAGRAPCSAAARAPRAARGSRVGVTARRRTPAPRSSRVSSAISLGVDVARGRERRADERHVRGLVRLAPMRHRREVRAVGLDEHPIGGRERGRGAHVVGRLERDDAAERQVAVAVERGARLVGPAGEAVEDRARRARPRRRGRGTSRPRRCASGSSTAGRRAWRARCAAGTRPPARRAASARSADRTRPRRSRRNASAPASATSPSHSASSRDASCGCSPRSRTRRRARRELERLPRRLEPGAHAHHPLDTRGARPFDLRVGIVGLEARLAQLQLQVAVRVDPAAPSLDSRRSPSSREQRLALFELRARGQQSPLRPRPGSRWSSGRPGQAEPAPQLAPTAFGITGDASNATMRSVSRQSPSTPRPRPCRRPC